MILSVTEILIVQRAIGEGSSLVTLRLKTRYVENKKLLPHFCERGNKLKTSLEP